MSEAWASADFFPGEGKIFQGGKSYYLPKKPPKNILFFSKKVKKHTILAGQGGSRAPSCPPLRTPMVRSDGIFVIVTQFFSASMDPVFLALR